MRARCSVNTTFPAHGLQNLWTKRRPLATRRVGEVEGSCRGQGRHREAAAGISSIPPRSKSRLCPTAAQRLGGAEPALLWLSQHEESSRHDRGESTHSTEICRCLWPPHPLPSLFHNHTLPVTELCGTPALCAEPAVGTATPEQPHSCRSAGLG